MSRGMAELSGRKPEMQILKNIKFAVIIIITTIIDSFQINEFFNLGTFTCLEMEKKVFKWHK